MSAISLIVRPCLISISRPINLLYPVEDVLHSHGGSLLSATGSGDGATASKLGKTANASPTCAFVIHSFAGAPPTSHAPKHKTDSKMKYAHRHRLVHSSFSLISHTIREAKLKFKLELNPERTDSYSYHSTNSHNHQHYHVRERSMTKHDTRIVHVCRFNSALSPTQLLERCNRLCMFFTALGFTLEIVGYCAPLGNRWVLMLALPRRALRSFVSLLLFS